MHIYPILLLIPPLPQQDGPRCRLPVRDVEVGLYPHAADNLPASLRDSLLDLAVQLWVFVSQPVVIGCGGLCECIARILIHELQGGRERPLDHIDGFSPRPQPGSIDVRIPGEMNDRRLQHRP